MMNKINSTTDNIKKRANWLLLRKILNKRSHLLIKQINGACTSSAPIRYYVTIEIKYGENVTLTCECKNMHGLATACLLMNILSMLLYMRLK